MRYLLFFFIIIFSFHAHGQTKKTCTTDYFGDKHCTSDDGITSHGTKDYFGDEIWIDRRLIDPRAVRANIERMHAENPKGSVVIQADKKSTNEMLVVVMDAARQAGVYNVSIAANN